MTGDPRARAALILGLILAPISTGCTLSHVGFERSLGNPGFDRSDYTYPEDGFRDARISGLFRVARDFHGDLYPDPKDFLVDGAALSASGFALRKLESYDGPRVTEDLAAKLKKGLGNRPLVVLIHGIGNTYDTARRSYKLARLRMEQRFPDQEFAYLEVYWDGYHGSPGLMWGYAQSSSLRAGLGLRRLLNRLDPKTPVRALTHSRGAAVIASALWNVPMPTGTDGTDPYRNSQRTTPTPDHLDLRVGMLAPAMGANAFDSYRHRTPARHGAVRHDRVVLGINEDDPAIGKGPLPSWMFGSTELGCSLDLFETAVKPVLGNIARLVDFSASGVHEFKDYLLRRPFEERFLPLLIGDGEGVPAN